LGIYPLCCTHAAVLGISCKRATGAALVALVGSLSTEVRQLLLTVCSILLASMGWPLPEAVPVAGTALPCCGQGSHSRVCQELISAAELSCSLSSAFLRCAL